MKLAINLLLLIVLALCIRQGFKKGLIGSIITLLLMIVSLVGANILADTYSKEIVPALEPFINGYMDSGNNTDTVLESLGYGDSDLSLEDILEKDGSLKYDYAYECLREIGIYKEASEDLAEDCVKYSEDKDVTMTESVITVVCNTIAYVGCVTVAFIMIFILLCAITEIFNLDIRLPGLDVVDEVSGSAIGLIIGFLFCVLICWVLGFTGLIIGKETAERSALMNFFLAFRFITRSLI